MQDQVSGAAMAMPPDPKVAFKAEWEALEIIDHQWLLQDVENEIIDHQKDPLRFQNSENCVE